MKLNRSKPDFSILADWKEWSEAHAISYFQTAQWAELLTRHFSQYRLSPIQSDRYFIPLIRERRWGGLTDSIYGMPMMTRGGILSREPLNEEDWGELLDLLARFRIGTTVLSLMPGCDPSLLRNGFRIQMDFTHHLSLTGGWESVQNHFERRCRKAIRRAEEEGVEAQRDESEEAISAHWNLVRAWFDRWNPNPDLTLDFTRDAAQSEHGRLYLARKQGIAVGSILAFSYDKEIFLWQGARTREDYPTGTDNLLIARIAQDACEEGLLRIDLGASLGDPGIEKFKDSFGAQKVGYAILKRIHPLLRFFKGY